MRPRELLSAIAGTAALAVAVLGVGGAFRWVQAVVALLLVLAVVPLVFSRRTQTRLSPLTALIGLATGLTLLQLIPLPASIVALLDPEGAALRADGAELLNTSPWSSLSLDPPGGIAAACFFFILMGSALVALRFAAKERGRYRLLALVGIVCGASAVLAAAHKIVGAESLYGLYMPEQARPSILGPLLNENHLGMLMAVGTTVAIALTFHRNQPSRLRAAWLGVALACASVALMSQSRGATLALAGGVLVSGGVLVGQRLVRDDAFRKRGGFVTNTLPITVVVIAAIVVVLFASAGGVSDQLGRTSLSELHNPRSKVAIWTSSVALIEESPWIGVGRGAFEPAFTRHHPAAALNSFSHVENEYLQAIVDWGIPGTLLLWLCLGWLVTTCFRRWRESSLIAAPLGTLTVVGIQGALDFGMEMIGVAIPVVVVIATAAYTPLREEPGRRLLRGRVLIAAMIASLLLACVLLLSRVTASLAEDHEKIVSDNALEISDVRELAERHPLDYFAFAKAAEILTRQGDSRAVLMLNHALRLHPTHSTLHHLAARLLLKNGRPEQAAIEYSLALRSTPKLRPLMTEIATRLSPELAARTIPIDYPEPRMITELLAELQKQNVSRLWLLRILDERPENLPACEWLFSTAILARDLDAGLAATARCLRAAPSYEARVDLARMLLGNKRRDEARKVLHDVETWRGRLDTRAAGWIFLCDSYADEKNWVEARRCLRRLDGTGTVPPSQRPEITRRYEQIDQQLKMAPP